MDAICIGFAVADIIVSGLTDVPLDGSTTMAGAMTTSAGGDALNQAVALSRLGHSSGIMTSVGDDPMGAFVIRACEEAGVDTRGVIVTPDHPTWLCTVLLDNSGERSFIGDGRRGEADYFSLDTTRLDLIEPGVKVVSVGSMFANGPLDRDVLPAVLRKAREVGALTLTDAVEDRLPEHRDDILEVLPLLDYLVPSLREAQMITGRIDPDDCVDALLGYGVPTVVVKLGAAGVLGATKDQRVRRSALPATVVDTTGSGDNFVAGFISGILRGRDLSGCLDLGAATAAISVESVGASTGVRDYDQVLARLSA